MNSSSWLWMEPVPTDPENCGFPKTSACTASRVIPGTHPQKHVWNELRQKEFSNRVFESMEAAVSKLEAGLPRMGANTQTLRSLAAWPWIVSLSLKAN